MCTIDYPRFEDLHIAPDFLLIGAVAMHQLTHWRAPRHAPDAEPDTRPSHAKGQGGVRSYASPYVGVRLVRGSWFGAWGPRSRFLGPARPPTPAGEFQAAWDRAAALGRDWLERR